MKESVDSVQVGERMWKRIQVQHAASAGKMHRLAVSCSRACLSRLFTQVPLNVLHVPLPRTGLACPLRLPVRCLAGLLADQRVQAYLRASIDCLQELHLCRSGGCRT